MHSAFQIGFISKTFTAVAVIPLSQQRKFNLKDNYQKYFPDFFLSHRFTSTLLNQLKADTANYFTYEYELNELGLAFLADHHDTAALEVLKLATSLYPKSWNT